MNISDNQFPLASDVKQGLWLSASFGVHTQADIILILADEFGFSYLSCNSQKISVYLASSQITHLANL